MLSAKLQPFCLYMNLFSLMKVILELLFWSALFCTVSIFIVMIKDLNHLIFLESSFEHPYKNMYLHTADSRFAQPMRDGVTL